MQYRKKPVVIEAIQFLGENMEAVDDFMNGVASAASPNTNVQHGFQTNPARVVIQTLEGLMYGDIGDWVIRGIKGELYPCKPDIFEATYEAV